jgi:hypothetical protein
VELQWSGNKVLLPGTCNSTIGAAYKEYMTGDMAAYYKTNDNDRKAWKNQAGMALELYIDKLTVRDPQLHVNLS